MIVDVKVFDVGIQKALNINTFSCDWFGKSIIGKKKQTNKQTNKKTKKQQTSIQWKQKTKAPPPKKAPPTSLMIL